ncbi:hypothetical protein CDAR_175871 [Caerostris darwini]|uniref:Uncharacterized protein n=1 Tax=Caerostris darwini TaxID=1538125 RepID=A0AAV4WNL9_9ARAC|nr:hypothetical protein CDAR_175871 [Caerostris darwini]
MSPSESWDAIKNPIHEASSQHAQKEATNEITPNVPVRILGCNKNPIHEASSQPAQKGILLPISQQKQQMKLLQMSPSEFQDTIKSPIQEALSQPAQKGILLPISQQKQQMKLLQMSPSESWDAIKNPIHEASSQPAQKGILLPISQQKQQMKLLQMSPSESWYAIKILYTRHHRNLHKRYSTSHISTEATNEITPNVSVRISGYNKKSYTRGIIATCTTKVFYFPYLNRSNK